jgi:hypothetical protein
MNEKIYLDSEFDRIWEKIKARENITFLRFADGERAIMTGTPVHAQEGGWSSPSYVSKLGKDLLSSLTIDDNNVYYAISCPCCDQPSFYWYYTRINNKNITFANLWINANYNKFLNSFESLNREVVVIANFRAKDKAIGNLKILKFYSIGDDCISFWENEAEALINSIKNDFGNRDNLLYVVSAGPMSEPIIHALFNNNPNNSYIDFGSSIDKYYRGAITRPYMIEGTPYYNKNCWLPAVINTSVSVVLTLYKRPEKLLEQINAILNQTIKPKEIIVFHDASNFEVDELLIKEVKNKVDNYIKVENNVGVWGRFAGGLIAKSKYICFFDDDTIPGIRWLENCYTNIINKKGLYGTIGIDSWDLTKYPYDCYRRWGWHAPCDKTIKVDFVGHSWFLEKDWLGVMWINSSDIYSFKYVGEDAFLSFSLKKWLNINTYVPPHPIDNIDLYGSQPEKALKYGTESDVAISFNPQQLENMNLALKVLVKKGMHSQGHKGFNLSDIFQTSLFKTLFPNESIQKNIAKKLFKTFNL